MRYIQYTSDLFGEAPSILPQSSSNPDQDDDSESSHLQINHKHMLNRVAGFWTKNHIMDEDMSMEKR